MEDRLVLSWSPADTALELCLLVVQPRKEGVFCCPAETRLPPAPVSLWTLVTFSIISWIFCKWKSLDGVLVQGSEQCLSSLVPFMCLIGTRHPWTWVGCLGACRVVVVFPGKGGKEFSRFGTPHKMKGVLYLWGHLSPSTRDFQRSMAHILPWPLLGLNFSQQVSSLQENLRFFSLPHFFCFVLCKQFLLK